MEMLILRRLDPNDDASLKAYRLQVKERLYRFNFVSHLSHFSVVILVCSTEFIGDSRHD